MGRFFSVIFFTFHFSLFTFHFSLFTFHFSLFTFHFSLFTLIFSWIASRINKSKHCWIWRKRKRGRRKKSKRSFEKSAMPTLVWKSLTTLLTLPKAKPSLLWRYVLIHSSIPYKQDLPMFDENGNFNDEDVLENIDLVQKAENKKDRKLREKAKLPV